MFVVMEYIHKSNILRMESHRAQYTAYSSSFAMIKDLHLVIEKFKTFEDVINQEADLAGRWFTDNNLIMNLKKCKIEFVMYGICQKLSK